jgi:hypothetical protein
MTGTVVWQGSRDGHMARVRSLSEEEVADDEYHVKNFLRRFRIGNRYYVAEFNVEEVWGEWPEHWKDQTVDEETGRKLQFKWVPCGNDEGCAGIFLAAFAEIAAQGGTRTLAGVPDGGGDGR